MAINHVWSLCGDFQTLPMAVEPRVSQSALIKAGTMMMLSTRMTTGFGGLFAVTAILLAVQLVTGVQAFPL
jgi:hypothetical protein